MVDASTYLSRLCLSYEFSWANAVESLM
jgi:hypothetical protein